MKPTKGAATLNESYRLVFIVALALALHLSAYQYGPHLNVDGERLGPRDTTRSTTWNPGEGWTEDIRFTHNVHGINISDEPDIASEGPNVHLAFMNYQKDPSFKPYNRDLNIYYTRSTDGGRSWSTGSNGTEFIQLNSPVEDKFWGFAMRPAIAVGDSVVHVVWEHNPTGLNERTRIRYRRSVDSGQTWMNETIMNTANDSLRARLLSNGSSVHLFWEEHNLSFSNFFRERIYYSRSLDKGASWEARRELARVEGNVPGCYLNSIAESEQRILILYLCNNPPVAHFTRSLDNGGTWEDGMGNKNQSTVLVTSTGDDYWYPSAISAWRENVTVVFKREIWAHSTRSFQLVAMTSDDLGANWSSPIVLVDHTDVPSYPGCFENPPNLDDCGNYASHVRLASEGRHLYMVWIDSRVDGADDTEVFFMKSEDFGKTWSPQYRLTEASEAAYWPEMWTSDGMIHLSWVDWRNDTADICYKRFPDFGSLPSVETVGAFEITGTDALLKGRLNNLENYTLANVFFGWREKGGANWTRLDVGILHSIGGYQAHLSGLSPGTDYELRAGASTEGEVFGEVLNFTALVLSPPTDIRLGLHGIDYKDLRISWNASADDQSWVSSYSIYYSQNYDREGKNYSLLAEIPANGSSVYSYVHEDAGGGDGNSYFYFVQANSTSHLPSRSRAQVAKYSKFLSRGRHLISIPLILTSNRIEDALRTVQFAEVWHYDTSTGWTSYNKLKPYKKDLIQISRKMGMWVDVIQDSYLTLAGMVPENTTIQLEGGWNLVGFPSFDGDYKVRDLVEETGAGRVEGYDLLSPPFHLAVLADFDSLSAGCGYWVRVEAPSIWVVRN
ncbi:MAG: exo-alpha-sialidase [Thermoplasmata archaeon]|nr:exo-alpha-sialidase [Thermoplasmata archaeon]